MDYGRFILESDSKAVLIGEVVSISILELK